MNYKNILNNYTFKEEELLEYGFIKGNNTYVYKSDIFSNFYALIRISDKFEVMVYDKDLDEEYLPFKVNNKQGILTSKINDELEKLLNDMIEKCFYKNDIKEQLIKYARKKHDVLIENPWDKSPQDTTFKVIKNKKWYALLMNVPCSSLGIKSEEKVDIINLKNKPEIIEKIVDNKVYFKAYHMNKKYWFTIILNNNVDIEIVKTLMDESYEIVNKLV